MAAFVGQFKRRRIRTKHGLRDFRQRVAWFRFIECKSDFFEPTFQRDWSDDWHDFIADIELSTGYFNPYTIHRRMRTWTVEEVGGRRRRDERERRNQGRKNHK